MDASEVTRRLRERAIYASYRAQQNRINNGCGAPMNMLNNGGASFDSGILASMREGELFTSSVQRDAILASAACHAVETRDAIYMVGQFESDPITFFAAQEETSISLYKGHPSVSWSTFLVKFDLSGTPLWSTRINAVITDNSNNAGTDLPMVHVSSNSTIYVTGNVWFNGYGNYAMYFYNTGNCEPNIVIPTDRSQSQWIARYDSDGQVQWATYLRPQGSFDRSFLTSDSDHNVYLQVHTDNSFDIYNAGNHCSVVRTAYNYSNQDTFVIKYDPDGQFLWYTVLSSEANDLVASVKCDYNNHLYVAISLWNTCESTLNIYSSFNDEVPSFSMSAGPVCTSSNIIVAYNAGGDVWWATNISGADRSSRIGLAVDGNNNVYGSIMYRDGPINVYSENDQTTPAFTLSNSGNWDMGLVKFTAWGRAVWATRISGTGNEQQPSLGIDAANNLYVVGETNSCSVELYDVGSSDPSQTLTFGGMHDTKVYLIKYNTSGIHDWSSFVGPFNGSQTRNSIGTNADGSTYIVVRTQDGDTINFYDRWGNTPRNAVSNTSGGYFPVLMKYDTNGVPIWTLNTTPADLPQMAL